MSHSLEEARKRKHPEPLRPQPRHIEVEYDGEYPNACRGTLTIKVDGSIIYHKEYQCHSTGSVTFDDDWSEHVEEGELVWEEADQFDAEIQEAVKSKLSEVNVCCGGCV